MPHSQEEENKQESSPADGKIDVKGPAAGYPSDYLTTDNWSDESSQGKKGHNNGHYRNTAASDSLDNPRCDEHLGRACASTEATPKSAPAKDIGHLAGEWLQHRNG
ncbi:hypothetical protein TrVGV298_006600 [Trichoderma virens]|nr:hypothetical protein TrVGV298_006600 [Trichoderma virens]